MFCHHPEISTVSLSGEKLSGVLHLAHLGFMVGAPFVLH
jgi:hypothetical protein